MGPHRRGWRLGRGSLACLGWLIILAPALPAAAAPPETRPFRLRVVDEAGRPVEGVALDTRVDKVQAKARTDAQGRCSLEIPEPAPAYFHVGATGDGYVPVYVEWHGQGGNKPAIPNEYTLVLEKGTTIGGLIQDDQGKPIGGASVFVLVPSRATREPGKPRVSLWDYEAKTDAEGRWHCDVVPAKLDDVWLRLSHPDFASDTLYGNTPKPSLETLRDRSGVMVLKKGITVEGRVLSSDGKPIAGARIAQGSDRFGSHYPDTKSDEQGRFRFANCHAGEMILTVQARGYSPDLRKIVVAPGQASVDFALEPAHRIRARVVDPQGNPVAGAFVAADTWRGHRSIEFRVDTDKEGRFAWDDAPGDEVQFAMGKEGYMALRRKAITASSDELLITLIKPLKVKGAVTDADTGRPVDAFTVVPGIDWGNDQKPYWERQSARKQSGGHFEFDFAEPRPGHLVRIEAEGYLPASSRSFKDSEGDIRFDFALKKGDDLSGVVLGVDGQPLAGASVCLVTPEASAQLANGRPPDRRHSAVVETARDGRFRFPAQEGKFTLVVLHDSGLALRTASQIAAAREVKLEAWGQVEGYVRIGARPAAGEAVHLSVHQESGDDEPRPYFNYETTADARGHYVIERVPPGKVYVSREIKLSDRMTGYSHTTAVEVKAGQSARADIGGTGRPVVGRVIAPGGKKVDWSFGSTGFRAAQPELDIPKDLSPEQRARWYEEWSKTPEGKAYQERSQRNYSVKVQSDGTFRVDDIPAGQYDLNITVNEPLPENQAGIGGDLLGSVTHKVNVPEMPGGRSDLPLDVGTLELAIARRIKVGEPVPGFQVATLGGESLKLEDFRGKFVLLDFWATWCGPCVAETPHLKAVHEAFRKDDRFAMIGLSLDAEKEAPRQYVEKNSLGWHQAFLGDFSESKLATEYGVQSIPSIWLIGPDGKVIAKDLRGEAIKDTIASALGAAK